MKNQLSIFCLAATLVGGSFTSSGQDIVVKTARGGGLDSNAPMIHCDIFYDYVANQMRATLDTSQATPKLLALPPGYAFDSSSNYAVLNGKAYNYQYAWNPGGLFTNPPGAAIWIECTATSPGLETYDGPGNKMLTVPRSYEPIFGTAGSPDKWKWYGAMAHNTYAILNPTNTTAWAQYHIYFGDSLSGSRDGFERYGDATVTLTWTVDLPKIFVTPMMGGGQAYGDMVHIDFFYDNEANQLHAQVDQSAGIPELRPLESGFAFDPQQAYAILNGKAYNAQYGWNVGGLFTLPVGSAIWVELLDCTPGLETYSGTGRQASYVPILGTSNSPRLWKWSGAMIHNTYAVLNPPCARLFAEYHVYVGDVNTASRSNFIAMGDTKVRLEWTTVPVENSMTFKFGAMGETNGAPLCFLNQAQFTTNSESVVILHYTNSGPSAQYYQSAIPMLVVPASVGNGGPVAGHAAVGSRVEVQFVFLSGPPQGRLSVWDSGEAQPRFSLAAGVHDATNRFTASEGNGTAIADPFGFIQGRSFGVNQPGLYCLSFRLVDTSTNGLGGGPIHTPSAVYSIHLQGGLTIHGLTKEETSATAHFFGECGKSFYLERSSNLGPSALWQTVAGPVLGTNRFQTLTVESVTGSQSFFRLRSSLVAGPGTQ
jgi:hypothetical protein